MTLGGANAGSGERMRIRTKDEKREDTLEKSIAGAIARYFEGENEPGGRRSLAAAIMDSLNVYFQADENARPRFSKP